jgi:hypothetical protein
VHSSMLARAPCSFPIGTLTAMRPSRWPCEVEVGRGAREKTDACTVRYGLLAVREVLGRRTPPVGCWQRPGRKSTHGELYN